MQSLEKYEYYHGNSDWAGDRYDTYNSGFIDGLNGNPINDDIQRYYNIGYVDGCHTRDTWVEHIVIKYKDEYIHAIY